MTIVVVGAGSGMGAAVAHTLAPTGRLLLADRNPESAARVAAEVGGDAEAVACDITDQRQIDSLLAGVDQLDALVCSAGISTSMTSSGRQILEVNLIGVNRLVESATPFVRPGTAAVLFASMSGYRVPDRPDLFAILDDPLSPTFFDDLVAAGVDPDHPQFAYPMSKRGVQRMARRYAAAWGAKGGRIMSVSPGINDTPMNRSDEALHPMMADIIAAGPLGRRGTPQEVANVVAFLVSEGASFMTGSDVLVDGGMVSIIPEDSTGGQANERARA
jgi:NAD(P)-dependent dehydrogenase (short-subunit alcohol dehydrogenase family)